ncbi:hypothetical protein HMPREF9123_1645 [Neisseria bacilliformis ATCC BAA-1200]|uniref:Uncharacterized protein n=1 Tax=Neisseria bacilliformis ATCC BAA-1200 TaxID=888742 RepID=F2BD39_9NEIS|nr:hypothetical protein HMPREF9123_1645 [Neisseria bacilliformis ATCC BAA-1200]
MQTNGRFQTAFSILIRRPSEKPFRRPFGNGWTLSDGLPEPSSMPSESPFFAFRRPLF